MNLHGRSSHSLRKASALRRMAVGAAPKDPKWNVKLGRFGVFSPVRDGIYRGSKGDIPPRTKSAFASLCRRALVRRMKLHHPRTAHTQLVLPFLCSIAILTWRRIEVYQGLDSHKF